MFTITRNRVEGNVEVDMKSEITPLGEFSSLEAALLAATEFSENVRVPDPEKTAGG